MTARHESNISITISLAAAPVPEAGFGNVVVIFPKATNSLNGERVVTYTNTDDAQSDVTAGYLSSSAYDAAVAAFSQSPRPEKIKIANIDLVSLETYPEAITAILTADSDIYGICIASRDEADIAAVIADVEARRMRFVAQISGADPLAGTIPATLADYETARRTSFSYHDTDTEWSDVGWLAGVLAFDPDTVSAPWDRPVGGVSALATGLTEAQRDNLIAINVNVGLPYGGETFYMDPGVSGSGHPAYEVLTADWFYVRLREAVARLRTEASARGEKIPVSVAGQTLALAEVHALMDQGESAGHFLAGQRVVTAETITAADRAAGQFRITGSHVNATNGRLFDYTLAFTR